jgi:predicted nucleic acid-binding protein
MIVLDTNVLSEFVRPAPSPEVVRWAAGEPASSLFTTIITQAEVLYGIELMPHGKRRVALESKAQSMFELYFPNRILPFDFDAAQAFARIAAARRALGLPISPLDAQIAAIALSRGAKLATRDIADFEHCGVPLVNPWKTR